MGCKPKRAVPRDRDERRHRCEHGVPVEDPDGLADAKVRPERREELAVLVERHASNDVAERRAEDENQESAREEEPSIASVCPMTPPVAWAKRDHPAPIWNSSGIPMTTPMTNVRPKTRAQKRAESPATGFPRRCMPSRSR
jgi:hypothetical protein